MRFVVAKLHARGLLSKYEEHICRFITRKWSEYAQFIEALKDEVKQDESFVSVLERAGEEAKMDKMKTFV